MDQAYDHRADIFSVGVLLLELITGKNPFRADSPLESLRRIVQTPAPSMRALGVKVCSRLEWIVSRCLAKAPSDRFADAGELSGELDRWLQDNGHKIGRQEVAAALRETFATTEPLPVPAAATQELAAATEPLVAPNVRCGNATPLRLLLQTPRPGSFDERTTPNKPTRCRLVTVAGRPSLQRTQMAMRACRVVLANSCAADLLWVQGEQARSVADLRAGLLAQLQTGHHNGARADLHTRLRGAKAVVLLDDVDHVRDVAGFVAELLHLGEGLRVVCTTSGALNLEGEKVINADAKSPHCRAKARSLRRTRG
jgi:hypothetical protein